MQNEPCLDLLFRVEDEVPLRLHMWWDELGKDGQSSVTKRLGTHTGLLKIKPKGDLIEAPILFWDHAHNVFHFSDFELTLTLEEMVGYARSNRDLRHHYLIAPRVIIPHKFLDLLHICRQVKYSDLAERICSFQFLYSRYGQSKGFEVHKNGLCNRRIRTIGIHIDVWLSQSHF